MRALVFFAVLVVLIAIAAWFAEHPGTVTLRWQGWRVDTSVGVLSLGVAAVAVIAALVYRLWGILRRAPRRLAEMRERRRRRRGYTALTRGMVAVAAGDPEEARRQARRADSLLEELPLTMLLAAQAAQLEGDEAAARKYFAAMLERPETEFLGLRGLLLQAGREEDSERALRLAHRAYKLKPDTPWVLNSLFDLQIRKGQWREAQEVVRRAIRRDVIGREQGGRHKAILLHEQSVRAEADGTAEEALGLARRAFRAAPDMVPVAARLASLQIRAGKPRDGIKTIEKAWGRAPHPELARLYALAFAEEDGLERVKRFEKLLSLRPDHLESHVALAGAAMEARLWGQARTHLEQAQNELSNNDPPARIYRMMAELEEAEHDDGDAARRWLQRAGVAKPDEAWVCRDCGAQSVSWTPLCGKCQAFDTLEWRSPSRIGALVLESAVAGEAAGQGGGGGVDRAKREA